MAEIDNDFKEGLIEEHRKLFVTKEEADKIY